MKKLLTIFLFSSLAAGAQTTITRTALIAKASVTPSTIYRVIEKTDTTYWKKANGNYNVSDSVIKGKAGYFIRFVPSVQPIVVVPPVVVYASDVQTATVNCPTGSTGISAATIPAGAYTSLISKLDANNKAIAAALAKAQLNLSCQPNAPPINDTANTQFARFKIEGTPEQRALTVKALKQVKFPLDRLKFPAEQWHGGPHISWGNIINSGSYGVTNGDGWVQIETTLINNPELAQTVIINEIAHCVDSGFMTDEMRRAILGLVTNNNPNATWYPDYGKDNDYEYTLRECFHQIFTLSYTDRTTEAFRYSITPEQAPVIRKIIGVERTDGVK